MICISPSGALRASRNLYKTDKLWGPFVPIRDAVPGYSKSSVILGDIDGDGRVDYMLVDKNQEVIGFRNGGPTPGWPTHWQALGNVFHGSGAGKPSGWRLVDLNGDRRDDWLSISEEGGAIRTWINHRGRVRGSLRPAWEPMASTHVGAGQVDGYKVRPDNLSFPKTGINKSKRADYAFSDIDGNVTLWQNLGSGGKYRKGD